MTLINVVFGCIISVIFEFLKSNLETSRTFGQFIKISYNVNHLCDMRINRNNINSNSISQNLYS